MEPDCLTDFLKNLYKTCMINNHQLITQPTFREEHHNIQDTPLKKRNNELSPSPMRINLKTGVYI